MQHQLDKINQMKVELHNKYCLKMLENRGQPMMATDIMTDDITPVLLKYHSSQQSEFISQEDTLGIKIAHFSFSSLRHLARQYRGE